MSPKLILLHGFLGDAEDFAPLRAVLPEFETPALPGHGGACLDGSETTTSALERLAAEINDRAGDAPFLLGGYSLGGRLAAWLTHLGSVGPVGLVLLGASPGIANAAPRRARLARDVALAADLAYDSFAAGDFEAFLDTWYRQPLFGALREHPDYPALIARRLRHDPGQLARALDLFSVGRQPDLTARMSCPDVLYLAGGDDPKYAPIAAGLTGARVCIIPGAGHAIHLEKPVDVGREILDFWRTK